jgi:hypothetical protein
MFQEIYEKLASFEDLGMNIPTGEKSQLSPGCQSEHSPEPASSNATESEKKRLEKEKENDHQNKRKEPRIDHPAIEILIIKFGLKPHQAQKALPELARLMKKKAGRRKEQFDGLVLALLSHYKHGYGRKSIVPPSSKASSSARTVIIPKICNLV